MTAPGPQQNRKTLAELSVPSEPGNERRAMEEVAEAVQRLGLPERTLEKLKTAVAEATMNAMEHGNSYRAEIPVLIEVAATGDRELSVRITDRGSAPLRPGVEAPDLEAKLQNMQTPRGWGLFLVKNMVDEMRVSGDENHHTVELILHLQENGEGDG